MHRILTEDLPVDAQHEMVDELGHGGMGTVVVAEHRSLRREVAMKILREAGDKRLRLRFIEEARITGQLEHPNIVPVHDLGIDQNSGRLFFTMKRVRGQTLEDLLEEARTGSNVDRVTLRHLLRVFTGTCNAIGFAHSRGVVHRDLKPANIMTGTFGEVLVMDWGLAKPGAVRDADDGGEMASRILQALEIDQLEGQIRPLSRNAMTQHGEVIGTIPYMPPEQAEGRIDDIDERSDIYALGAILYQILCLEPPVSGSDPEAMIDRVIAGEIDDPREVAPVEREVPADLAAVAMKALASDPEDRYQSVRELREDIHRHLEGRSVSAKEDRAWEMVLKLVRRNRQVSIAVAVALVVLIGVVGVGYAINAEARRMAEERLANLRQEQAAREQAEVARESSDSIRQALVAQIEAENRREWQTIYTTDFADLEDFTVTTGWNTPTTLGLDARRSQLEPGPDGLLVHSDSNLAVVLQRSYGGDLRARYRATYHGGSDGGMHVTLGGSDWRSGYVFQVGGFNNSRAVILRGADRSFDSRTLASIPFELAIGQTYDVQASLRRFDDRVVLQLAIDGEQVLEVVDRSPLEVRLGRGNGLALLVNGPAETTIHELRVESLNAPMKVRVSDLARRQLELGHYATAANLYRELLDATHDDIGREAVAQSLATARRLAELESRLPAIRSRLEAAWPEAEIGIGLSEAGLSVMVQGGSVSDLDPLAGLPVQELRVRECPLRDIAALRGMALTSLWLQGLAIVDPGQLEVLRGMPLERTRILIPAAVDLEILRGMPLRDLVLGRTDSASLEALVDMPLELLSIASAPHLRSLNGLADQPLRELSLANTALTGLDGLACTGLARVAITHSPSFSDLELCRTLPGLTTLEVAGTAVEDLEPLRGLVLQVLDLSGTRVRDLAPLEAAKLDVLNIAGTAVRDLAPAVTPVLRYVDLSDTPVTDLSAFARCRLLMLGIAGTGVRSLAPLIGHPIHTLVATGAPVSDLSPLAGAELRSVLLDDTQVTDVTPLVGQLVRVLDLAGTPFTDPGQLQGLPLVRLRLPPAALTALPDDWWDAADRPRLIPNDAAMADPFTLPQLQSGGDLNR